MAHLGLSTGSWYAADTLLASGRTADSRRRRKIGHNTTLRRLSPDAIGVTLYSTTVLTFHRDGSIEVRTGGWDSTITRDRINGLLPAPWAVYSYRQRGESRPWLWAGGHPVTPFVDGLTIHPDDGSVSFNGAVILTADDIAAIRSAAETAAEERDAKRAARYVKQHAERPYASSDAFRHRWDCKACTALREAEYVARRMAHDAAHDRGEHVATRPVFDWDRDASGGFITGTWHDTGAVETYSTCPWECPQRKAAY